MKIKSCNHEQWRQAVMDWYWANEEMHGILYARLSAALAAQHRFIGMETEKLRTLDDESLAVLLDTTHQIEFLARRVQHIRALKKGGKPRGRERGQ